MDDNIRALFEREFAQESAFELAVIQFAWGGDKYHDPFIQKAWKGFQIGYNAVPSVPDNITSAQAQEKLRTPSVSHANHYARGWNDCLESNYWLTPRHQPDWKSWGDEQPAEPGMYLTYWCDGTLETYPLDQDELEAPAVTSGNTLLTHWAELPQAPGVSNG